MRSILSLSVIAAVCGGLSACGSDSNSNDPADSIEVMVSDYATDTAITSAYVRGVWHFDNGDTREATALVDESGVAQLQIRSGNLDALTHIVVSAGAPQFNQQYQVVSSPDLSSTESLELQLQDASVEALDYSAVNSLGLSTDGRTVVSLNGGALVDESGNEETDALDFYATLIDPSADPALMPGHFFAGHGELTSLIESFGAINIQAYDSSNELAQLAEGQTAQVRIPVAAGSGTLPDSVSLFYFDDTAGYWVRAATATLSSDSQGYYYEGEIDRLGSWTTGRRYESVSMSGCLINQNGSPVSAANITVQGLDYVSADRVMSDADGDFEVQARQNSEVLFQAQSDGQYVANVSTTGNQDRLITDCIEMNPVTVSVQLTWGEAPADLDTHLEASGADGEAFHIWYNGRSVVANSERVYLDVDDVSSFGPEVLTFSDFPYVAGSYEYFVHNYTAYAGDNSVDIGDSGARVELTINGEVQTFTPPAGSAGEQCWSVFRLDVSEAGEVEVITTNEYSSFSSCYGSLLSSSTARTMSVQTTPVLPQKSYVK